MLVGLGEEVEERTVVGVEVELGGFVVEEEVVVVVVRVEVTTLLLLLLPLLLTVDREEEPEGRLTELEEAGQLVVANEQ